MIGWLAFAVPWDILPTKLLPKKLSAYKRVESIAKGLLLSNDDDLTFKNYNVKLNGNKKNLSVIALITTPQNLVEVRKKRAIELGL